MKRQLKNEWAQVLEDFDGFMYHSGYGVSPLPDAVWSEKISAKEARRLIRFLKTQGWLKIVRGNGTGIAQGRDW